MPLLTCFHNADAVALKLESGALNDTDDNLTATQRMLLRYHFKLGHLASNTCSGFFAVVSLGLLVFVVPTRW